MADANLDPVSLAAKEGLAIVNGTAFSAGVGALVLHDICGLVALSQVLTAMSVEALAGTAESFHPWFAAVRAHPGQIEASYNIFNFLKDSKLTIDKDGSDKGSLLQDRYPIRTASEWIGPILEACLLAYHQIEIECNSVTCGNTGYDLLRLQESLREQSRELVDIISVAGRLVLQDLPEVIDSIEDKVRQLDALGVQKQKYNFFTPQPTKGAHVYFMHFVLHDFSDETARSILYNVALGMAPNRSRLLLNEIVFPTRDPPLQMALWDVQMKILLNRRERTEGEWKNLVERPYDAGEAVRLEVIRVWSPPRGAGEGIIEILRRA